jgi:hypothetical protein
MFKESRIYARSVYIDAQDEDHEDKHGGYIKFLSKTGSNETSEEIGDPPTDVAPTGKTSRGEDHLWSGK